MTGSIIIATICIPLCIESYFDRVAFNAPLWLTIIPICVILLAIAITELYDVFYMSDLGLRLFRGYDYKYKRVITVFNVVCIVFFGIAFIFSLYFL